MFGGILLLHAFTYGTAQLQNKTHVARPRVLRASFSRVISRVAWLLDSVWYQYFTSGIHYCKFKTAFSTPWYYDQAIVEVTSTYVIRILITVCMQ